MDSLINKELDMIIDFDMADEIISTVEEVQAYFAENLPKQLLDAIQIVDFVEIGPGGGNPQVFIEIDESMLFDFYMWYNCGDEEEARYMTEEALA